MLGYVGFRPTLFTCIAHLLYYTLYLLYKRHSCIFYYLRNTIQSFSISKMEVVKLKIIKEEGINPSDPNQIIPMGVLWLFPQFFWLGLTEGLANDGLQEFFYNHVATSMRSYGPSFSDCVLGIGNFISMPFVLLFRSWFKDSINTSHLDRYYLALAILSFVFLVFYVCASFSITSVHMGSASEDEEANEGEELAEILVENLTDSQLTRSVSFSLRRINVGHVDTGAEPHSGLGGGGAWPRQKKKISH